MFNNKSLIGKLALLLATLIWGTSFIIVEDVVEQIPTNALLAIRFLSAAIILSIFFIKSTKKINKGYILKGALLGTLLFLAYMFQTLGISFPDNTPGKNAFLTAVYCIIVPFIAWAFLKKRPDRYNCIAAVLCIAGIGFVSLNESFYMGIGDTLTLVGGLFYAFHIIAVSKLSEGRDIITLTIIQFFTSGIWALILFLATESWNVSGITITPSLIFSVAYLALCCTAIALTLQNFGQKHTSPSSASIILSLESVFGVLFSVLMGRETPTIKMILGFVLIFIALLISETKLSFLKRKQ